MVLHTSLDNHPLSLGRKKNLTTVVVAPGIIFNFTCVLLISFLIKKKDIFEFKTIQWLNL